MKDINNTNVSSSKGKWMDKKKLYLQVYRLLELVTPLKKDCGTLCNKACCQGIDHESGMYLFPGEEELLDSSDFLTIKPVTSIEESKLLAICNGTCDRYKRPLACRVFPLTPYITPKDLLTIKMDPRANHLCPLARCLERSELNPDFIKKVRQGMQLLLSDPEIKEFVFTLSRWLDELHDFKNVR
jgi:hypothetical protein